VVAEPVILSGDARSILALKGREYVRVALDAPVAFAHEALDGRDSGSVNFCNDFPEPDFGMIE
jgi:hypothetical protein